MTPFYARRVELCPDASSGYEASGSRGQTFGGRYIARILTSQRLRPRYKARAYAGRR